jgi:hypothetical protein
MGPRYVAPMALTRRHVLAASALVAGGAAAGAGGVAWRWYDQPAAAPFAHLSPDEVAILDAIAEACFPRGGDPAIGGAEAHVSRYFDGVLGGLTEAQRTLLKLGIHALDALALPTHGGLLSDLPVADASDAIASWLAHPRYEVRGVAQSITLFVAMAYFAHPAVRGSVADSFRCGFSNHGGLPDRLGPA